MPISEHSWNFKIYSVFRRLTRTGTVEFVAMLNAEKVGAIGLFPDGMESAIFYGKGTWYISDLLVLEAHRKQGLGSFLVSLALEHARKNGSKNVVLHSVEAAKPLYKRLGFSQVYDFSNLMALDRDEFFHTS